MNNRSKKILTCDKAHIARRRIDEKERFRLLEHDDDVTSMILSFLLLPDARCLRAANSLTRSVVTSYPWEDTFTRIRKVAAWRSSFPRAIAASLYRARISDDGFPCLSGIKVLRLFDCSITPAVFQWLRGIRELVLHCPYEIMKISGENSRFLAGVRKLSLSGFSVEAGAFA